MRAKKESSSELKKQAKTIQKKYNTITSKKVKFEEKCYYENFCPECEKKYPAKKLKFNCNDEFSHEYYFECPKGHTVWNR